MEDKFIYDYKYGDNQDTDTDQLHFFIFASPQLMIFIVHHFLPKANKHDLAISILISAYSNVKQLLSYYNFMLTYPFLFIPPPIVRLPLTDKLPPHRTAVVIFRNNSLQLHNPIQAENRNVL